jgi:hypothetical protein
MTTPTNPNLPDGAGAGDPTRASTEQAHVEERRRLRATQQADDPARIRDEIRMTRTRMDDTLYELEDRVAPSRVAERAKARARTRLDAVRGSIMGTVDDVTPTGSSSGSSRGVGDVASDAADQARQAPQAAREKTRGNPLAAGMIAFGVGALAAALLPESDQETRLVEGAADNVDLQKVRGEVEQAVQDVREPVQQRAQEGVDDLTDTAQGHAQAMKDEAASSGARVRSDAQDAGRQVHDQVDDT